MLLFCSNLLCNLQTLTLSQDSKISLSRRGFTSPLRAEVLCLQSLLGSSDERHHGATSIITDRQCSIQHQPPVEPWVSKDNSHTSATDSPKSLTTLHMKLHAWRPSGYAEFSIPNASNFSVTCSGINLVAFRVYSISLGQFMNLFLALSLKSSSESQNEDRQSQIQVRLFKFLPGDLHVLLVGRTVTIRCCRFTQPICKWKPLESIKYLDDGDKPRDSFKVTFTCVI